jgi:flagellar hook protein FlgE
VTVSDDKGDVGTGDIRFQNGTPDPAASSFTLTFAPAGTTGTPVTFDFSTDTTSFSSGTQSTLAVKSQDGFAAGALTKVSFDKDGNLLVTYSNGQVTKPQRLALASFESPDATLTEIGGNEFTAVQGSNTLHFGNAGTDVFGKISSGVVEISNVDLSQEFSDLIVTQRGYQASSQLISTANELVQELLDMRGKR